MKHFLLFTTTLLITSLLTSCGKSQKVKVSGELKKWHKITLTFDGPECSETDEINPFTDYRLDVSFKNGNKIYHIPGYFAADGEAAYTSAEKGNKWRVHFSPDQTGNWLYTVSFKKGENIALADSIGEAPSAGFMDGLKGTFEILASDKTGKDLRAKGRLDYVGENYPRFAETGEYFLKCGSDAPENLLAYYEFDNTPNVGERLKKWEAHAQHYNTDATPYLWGPQKDAGKNILGAINYLSNQGMNAFSFLTFNFDGDDRNVFMNRLRTPLNEYEAYANKKNNVEGWNTYADKMRYDVSKMDQWEKVFEYGDLKGMFMHFKTAENENDNRHDGGETGLERKLYYRELIARYGHHLAINWNLGEENVQTTQQQKDMATYFQKHDPYKHLVVLHTFPNQHEKVYQPLLGQNSELTGLSIQTQHTDFRNVYPSVKKWVLLSDSVGKPWVVACDEPGDAGHALLPDVDDAEHDIARINALWGTFMAGGVGTEWYFGYKHAHSDLTCEDFASRHLFWKQGKVALDFFKEYQLPVYNMKPNNSYVTNDNWSLAGKNNQGCLVVLAYVKDAKGTQLNLPEGEYELGWCNAKTGEGLSNLIETTNFSGGSRETLTPPSAGDWLLLVKALAKAEKTAYNLSAITDFKLRNVPGYFPAYIHYQLNAIGIDASIYKGWYAAAIHVFKGLSGEYNLTLNTLTETDGESEYIIFVNDVLIGSFTNPETDEDFKPAYHIFENVKLEQGDVIKVEFNSTANGKVPEGDGFAFSRGRWTNIELTPTVN